MDFQFVRTQAALVAFVLFSAAVASGAPCTALQLKNAILIAEGGLAKLKAEFPQRIEPEAAWKRFTELHEGHSFGDELPPRFVASVLIDAEMQIFADVLSKAILGTSDVKRSQMKSFYEAVHKELVETLQLPESDARKRVEEFKADQTEENFLRLLGDMTLEEMKVLTFGKNPLEPSPNSLLGKYIAESGASVLVRSFPVRPGSNELGPERIVVSVSSATLPVFKKYFVRKEYMSVINHAEIVNNGYVYSYYTEAKKEVMIPGTENKIFPIVMFKTTEGQRLSQFLEADEKYRRQNRSWSNEVQQPWKLGQYCAKSAYTNCTQKVGNIPIGDARVKSYTFPGAVDGYAEKESAADTGAARKASLQEYNHPDPLVNRVWKYPGNEQLADVLGQGKANEAAEFANPGWVIQTLIGPTTNERVPLIFVVRTDHTKPIDPKFVPIFETPM